MRFGTAFTVPVLKTWIELNWPHPLWFKSPQAGFAVAVSCAEWAFGRYILWCQQRIPVKSHKNH
jgi:hypothetical protein